MVLFPVSRVVETATCTGPMDFTDVFDETFARICHDKPRPNGIAPLEQLVAQNAEFEMAYFYNETLRAISLKYPAVCLEFTSLSLVSHTLQQHR